MFKAIKEFFNNKQCHSSKGFRKAQRVLIALQTAIFALPHCLPTHSPVRIPFKTSELGTCAYTLFFRKNHIESWEIIIEILQILLTLSQLILQILMELKQIDCEEEEDEIICQLYLILEAIFQGIRTLTWMVSEYSKRREPRMEVAPEGLA